MLTIFGSDVPSLIKFALFLVAILAVVGVFYIILRRMTGVRLMSSGSEQGRSRQPRLGVVDVYDLDRTRQLVLLRRDNVEHLLLIGGPNDTVIETNIVRVSGNKLTVPAELQIERTEQPHAETAPVRPLAEHPVRPVIEGGAVKTPERQTFAEAPYAPQPVASQAVVSAASFAAVAAATQQEHEAQTAKVPEFLRTSHGRHGIEPMPFSAEPMHESAPSPAPVFIEPESVQPVYIEPEVPPFTAHKPVEPSFPVIPPIAPRHPPAPETSYVEPARIEPVFAPEPVAAPQPAPVPAFEPEPAVLHEPVVPAPKPVRVKPEPIKERWSRRTPFAGLDSSVSDYASFPIQMEPQQPAPVEAEAPVPPVIAQEPEPVPAIVPPAAPAEAAPQADDAVFSDMARQLEEALASNLKAAAEAIPEQQSEPESAPEHDAEMKPHGQDEEPAAHHEPVMPEPAPVAEPVKTEPKSAAQPAAKQSADPFSLDDIEAEFARLLGRSEDKAGKT